MKHANLSDILDNNYRFDPDWYTSRYRDVTMLGMDARQHFLRYGHLLGRGISAEAPRVAELPQLARALSRPRDISYCIPIMNRPDDIRGTLRANLRENAPWRERLEFVLIFFDQDHATHTWIRESFAEDLAEGALRLIVSDRLESWHFGRAKNAFKPFAAGAIYSSLDGDNFVTAEETAQLLDIHAAHPQGFIFHHFSGAWGDGSSGRVSLPMRFFHRIGYDEAFLPRQYDEMDLILSTLITHPDVPFVRYDIANHGLSSGRSSAFLRETGITNPEVVLPAVRRVNPMNPKAATYVSADPELHAMQDFNQALCYLKNTPLPGPASRYLTMAVKARHRLVDVLPAEKQLDTFFWRAGRPEVTVAPGEISLFACMKDDEAYLDAFQAHYRRLGVAHLFIVDDGSVTPIAERLTHPHVHVFRPKVGNFVTAKGLWLEALIKAHLAPGAWALTVDADEFLDLPAGFADLAAVIAALQARGAGFAPGLLVDMLPADGARVGDMGAGDFLAAYDHHLFREDAPEAAYAQHNSIAWGFGPYARLSWSVDARFHGFGTYDSLRKIPLFCHRAGQHLNQGFHSLHYTDATPTPGTEIWDTPFVLPVRHYKLAKLFSDTARAQMAARVKTANGSPYHARTTENIARIFGAAPAEALARLAPLPRRPLDEGLLPRLAPRSFR